MARNKHGGKREGSGRPRVGETRIAIRLTDEQVEWLDKQCQQQGMNRSEVIRELIEKSRLEQIK
jgi:metal-responsive CopG/Arc/MetJ family transcriptional regulator